MYVKALLSTSGLALCLLAASAAHADSVSDFYRGKDVIMEIGYSPGGGYDVYARAIARFLGKHIPGNPTVVPKNLEGAGSLRLANWLYSAAPKDGTEIGIIGRGIAFDPLLGNPGANFDARKFTWLGSANNEVSVCVAWHTSGITKFQDLYTNQMSVGGTGGGSDTDVFPQVLNKELGTKMKVVSGYPGGNDIDLAMERGEVQGRCGWSWSSVITTHQDWVDQHQINILAQLSVAKHPDLPNVPLVMEFATNPDQKQMLKLIFSRQVMGRPFLAPPELPPDRAKALQQAFLDTLHDPEFLAEAKRMKLEINPVSGSEVAKVLDEAYQTPKTIVDQAAMIVNGNKGSHKPSQ